MKKVFGAVVMACASLFAGVAHAAGDAPSSDSMGGIHALPVAR